MSKHHWSDCGRFTAHFHDDKDVIVVTSSARMWRFVLDAETGVAELAELVDTFDDMTAEELRWMVNLVASVETIIEHAPHDLQRYGEIGVTC